MEPEQPDHPRPRVHILGRRFRLGPREEAMGVMVQENEVVRIPKTSWDTDPPLGTATIFGFLTPPIISALWHSLTLRQPGGCLMRSIRRVKAVFDNFRDLWNDFCVWSSQRQFHELDPQPTTFSEQDHNAWRGPKAAQYQIGYLDPSADPKWRMKQIIEVKDYDDINRVFRVACSNLSWTWRNRHFGSTYWKFHVPRLPNGGSRRRRVTEPPW